MTTRTRRGGVGVPRWAGLVSGVVLGLLWLGTLPAGAALREVDSDCGQGGCSQAEVEIDQGQGIAYADGFSLGWPLKYAHKAIYRSWVDGQLVQDRENSGTQSSLPFPELLDPCNGPTTVRARTVSMRKSDGAFKAIADTSVSGVCNPYDSPIALDLDESGVIEIGTAPKVFDLDADGSAEQLAEWFAGSGDGILYDATMDGTMSGVMLFGNEGDRYPSGFEKLAAWDNDGNGVLAGGELDGLAVWIDDGNARFHQSESAVLDEVGVVSISLDYDENYASTAGLADGTAVLVQDIWFRNRL